MTSSTACKIRKRSANQAYEYLISLSDSKTFQDWLTNNETDFTWVHKRNSMTNAGKKYYYICNYRIKKGYVRCPAVIYALFPNNLDPNNPVLNTVMVYSCGHHEHRRLNGGSNNSGSLRHEDSFSPVKNSIPNGIKPSQSSMQMQRLALNGNNPLKLASINGISKQTSLNSNNSNHSINRVNSFTTSNSSTSLSPTHHGSNSSNNQNDATQLTNSACSNSLSETVVPSNGENVNGNGSNQIKQIQSKILGEQMMLNNGVGGPSESTKSKKTKIKCNYFIRQKKLGQFSYASNSIFSLYLILRQKKIILQEKFFLSCSNINVLLVLKIQIFQRKLSKVKFFFHF